MSSNREAISDKGKSITLLRLGLHHESSTLLVEYSKPNISGSSESANLRHRKIKLRRGNCSEISKSLLENYPEFFKNVPISTLYDLLTCTGSNIPSFSKDTFLSKIGSKKHSDERVLQNSEFEMTNASESIYGDLNKVSDCELQIAKEHMDKLFVKNGVRPGDRDYEFDIRVEFKGPESDSSWD